MRRNFVKGLINGRETEQTSQRSAAAGGEDKSIYILYKRKRVESSLRDKEVQQELWKRMKS